MGWQQADPASKTGDLAPPDRRARLFEAPAPGSVGRSPRRRPLCTLGGWFRFHPAGSRPGEMVGAPDFVGIGVQKAGTTWWHGLIAAHPQVSARPDFHKERHFFDRFAVRAFGPADVSGYHGWFPRQPGTLAGEWTPDYVHMPWVPALLAQAAPKARLLVLLRDPVERLRSGLSHQRAQRGRVTADGVGGRRRARLLRRRASSVGFFVRGGPGPRAPV